ncbi:hypothetical protein [Stappia sp. TSB10GB4]|uniref:hypothetical protein n=1 Tax=Stappia sp. TSB10GB4 TaxID=2003584 RepID=UPI001646AA2A|nr:hypothetical protein [Stappia sp. TSB10GB4]
MHLTHLSQALVIRAISRPDGKTIMNGAALAVLRAGTLTGLHDDHPAAAGAKEIRRDIMALTVADMPPPTDLVAILLETLSQRLGGLGHAAAWRSIGINPNRGRDLLARYSRAVDWPIWKTLRDAALPDGLEPVE